MPGDFFCFMPYHFYILHSQTLDRYYIGYTSNLADRLKKHNTYHKGFTGRVNDWRVVYKEAYAEKSDAYARERQVKSWKSRKLIELLIDGGSAHPDFTSGGS